MRSLYPTIIELTSRIILQAVLAQRIMLFGVSPLDPVTLSAVVTLVTVAAVCAAVIPAARAARVDPMTTLRAE